MHNHIYKDKHIFTDSNNACTVKQEARGTNIENGPKNYITSSTNQERGWVSELDRTVWQMAATYNASGVSGQTVIRMGTNGNYIPDAELKILVLEFRQQFNKFR